MAGRKSNGGDDLSLPAVAQFFENPPGPKLAVRLRDWIDAHPSPFVDQFTNLARSPLTKFVIWSYGSDLESALLRIGRQTATVVTDFDVPFGEANPVIVVKPLGEFSRPTSLVITEDGYDDFFDSRRKIVDYMRA